MSIVLIGTHDDDDDDDDALFSVLEESTNRIELFGDSWLDDDDDPTRSLPQGSGHQVKHDTYNKMLDRRRRLVRPSMDRSIHERRLDELVKSPP